MPRRTKSMDLRFCRTFFCDPPAVCVRGGGAVGVCDVHASLVMCATCSCFTGDVTFSCFTGDMCDLFMLHSFCVWCPCTARAVWYRKKLTVDQFLNNVLPDLAINQVIEKKKSKSPTPDDPAVQEELNLLKTKISTKYREWISADNVSSVGNLCQNPL